MAGGGELTVSVARSGGNVLIGFCDTGPGIPPEFLTRAATVVGPGTTMVITQLAASPATTTTVATDFTVVTAEAPTKD